MQENVVKIQENIVKVRGTQIILSLTALLFGTPLPFAQASPDSHSHRVRSAILGQWRGIITASDGTRIQETRDYRPDGTVAFRALLWFKGSASPSHQWGTQIYTLEGHRISEIPCILFIDGNNYSPTYVPKEQVSEWSIKNNTLTVQTPGAKKPKVYQRIQTKRRPVEHRAARDAPRASSRP